MAIPTHLQRRGRNHDLLDLLVAKGDPRKHSRFEPPLGIVESDAHAHGAGFQGEDLADEVLSILFPTFAYVEDETGRRPEVLLLCGFGGSGEAFRLRAQTELGVEVEPLRSRFGTPSRENAGLLGYLESVED